ncbi:MAG TPA: hypothetical protein VEQ42_09720 [Pyrinomonadaceae bacterium]|nr:hypothetical protein [Pyrinomonadaceae bacterium]
MSWSRVVPCLALLASLPCLPPAPRAHARTASPAFACHGPEEAGAASPARREGGGIREVVPGKYAARYAGWKKEFLSTETGRRQWAAYEHDPQFTLTVVVTHRNPQGGGTGGYRWDESGKLVAATITLGSRIDEGYPDPIYFPVMNSLMSHGPARAAGEDVLAAAKIAHEFGHLVRTARTDTALYRLQTELIPAYNKILLTNGRNTGDERLLEMARRMGGTPVEIWEDREYWGEANAMLYLRDRFTDDQLRCSLFKRIRQSVELYAKGYGERFSQVAQSSPAPGRCGWH